MPTPIQNAIDRIGILGRISDRPDYLVRTFLSPANQQAASQVIEWMESLGMRCCHAPDGTIRGIMPGANPGAAPLLLGSHLDTVIDAGRYDGALGIIAAIAALEILAGENITLPFPVHVLGFSDEEGIRFHTTYLGSRSISGKLDDKTMSARDASGLSLADALATEGWHDGAVPILYQANSTLGYVELHIEQGRVLESENAIACVVSSIAGQSRLAITLTGRADHAGTTPMHLRRDALTGAAACIIAAESMARANPPLVITVGKIEVHPGASNSVPQSATFTIDLRHPDDAARKHHLADLYQALRSISTERALALDWQLVQETDAVHCDSALTNQLLDALSSVTGIRRTLPSGAGHDAVALSAIAPVAMLFIRCRDGLSHQPAEFASSEDIAAGISILVDFLKNLPP